MTFFDRVDQASVDPKALTGGPFKIAGNIESFKPNLKAVVEEAFVNNPRNTQKQIDTLVKDNPFLQGTKTYETGMQRLKPTDDLYKRFEFNEAGQARVIGQQEWVSKVEQLKAQIRASNAASGAN